jgi:hypothetical protein
MGVNLCSLQEDPYTTTHSLQPSKYGLQKFIVDTHIFVADYIRSFVNKLEQMVEILVLPRACVGQTKNPAVEIYD